MLSRYPTSPPSLDIESLDIKSLDINQLLLSQSTKTILSELNKPEYSEKLSALLISKTIFLDNDISNTTLAIKPAKITNNLLKFRVCLLYLNSISQAISNKKISQGMYHAAINVVIQSFKELNGSFIKNYNVWGAFLQAAPEFLSSAINNPLLNSPNLIKKQLSPLFSQNITQGLLLATKMAYKKYHQVSFIIYLVKNKITQKKFLSKIILSIYKNSPSILTAEETSNIINYFVVNFDKPDRRQESLKKSALISMIKNCALLKEGENNPFIFYIQQNHDFAIEIIKKNAITLKIPASLILSFSNQTKIWIEPLLAIEKVQNEVNRILYDAIIKTGNLNNIPLSSKQNSIYISKHIASTFNSIILPSQNPIKILRKTLTISEKYLFKDTEVAIYFINQTNLSVRYHFSLAFICHQIKEKSPITPALLENISKNLPPITEDSISESPFSSFRLILIMTFIMRSKLTKDHNISKDNLPLLYWMIKYFHNIINPDFFSNSHETFISDCLENMKFSSEPYPEQSLIEQIEAFTRKYYLRPINLCHTGLYTNISTTQVGEPPEKRAHTRPFEAIPLSNSEPLNQMAGSDLSSLPPPQQLPSALTSDERLTYAFDLKVDIPDSLKFQGITDPYEDLFNDTDKPTLSSSSFL